MSFAKGYVRDEAAKRTQRPSHELLALKGISPLHQPKGNADLTKYEAPIMDQGQFGSCTGHGTSQLIYTAMNAAGDPLPWVPSQSDPYAGGRARARAAAADPTKPLPKLTDDGAMPADVMAWISNWGIRKSKGPTADGRNSDCDSSNVNAEPTLEQLEEDVLFVVVGEYRIDETADDVVTQICFCLDEGIPVGIGAFVDTVFEDWSPGSSPVPAPNTNDPTGGGHWFAIQGYITLNGKRVFKITNSWGIGWGDGGHAYVSEEFVKQAWDLYAMQVSRKAA